MIDKTGRNCLICAALMILAFAILLLNAERIVLKVGIVSLTAVLGLTGLIGTLFLIRYLITPPAARLTQILLAVACPITLLIKWLFGINLITRLEKIIDSIQEQKDSNYKLLLGLSTVLIAISVIGCPFLIGLL